MKKKNLNYFVSAYKDLLKNGDVQIAYAVHILSGMFFKAIWTIRIFIFQMIF